MSDRLFEFLMALLAFLIGIFGGCSAVANRPTSELPTAMTSQAAQTTVQAAPNSTPMVNVNTPGTASSRPAG